MKRHWAVAVFIGTWVLASAFPAVGASDDAGQALFVQAEKLHKEARTHADLQQAAGAYEKALAAFTKTRNATGRQQALYQIGLVRSALNDHGKALVSFEQSRALARKAQNRGAEADCLLSMAEAAGKLGRIADAVAFCDQALELRQEPADGKLQVRVSYRAAIVLQDLGARPRAVELLARVVQQARELNEEELEFTALDRQAQLSEEMGSIESALTSLERVLEYRKRTGDKAGTISILNRLGDLARDLARWPKAEEYYLLAMEAAREQDNLRAQMDCLIRLGTLAMHVGEYARAIKPLEEALELSGKLDEPGMQANVLIHLGYVYRDRGKYSKAAEYFSQALELVKKTRNTDSEGLLLSNLGRLYLDWGEHDKAMACFEEALKLSRGSGDTRAEAQSVLLVGKALAERGQFTKALELLTKARTLFQRVKAPTREVDVILGEIYINLGDIAQAAPFVLNSGSNAALGRLFLAKSEFGKAAEYYCELLRSGEQAGRPDDVFAAHTGLGLAYEGLGDFTRAEDSYANAVHLMEELRSTMLPAARRRFLDVRVHGFYRSEPARGLTRSIFKQGRAADSIAPSELARARALADRLALGPDAGYSGVPLAVQEKEAKLLARVSVLKELRDCCPREENPERYENLTRQIENAQKELASFVDMLWQDYRPYAAVKYPRTVNLKELDIPKSAHVIVFDLLGDGVGVKLLLGNEIVTSQYVSWKEADVEAAVRRFRASFERLNLAGFDCELAKMLYSRLIAPVIPFVPQHATVAIIPDGVLALLPFEALVVQGSAKWQKAHLGWRPSGLVYFGDTHRITYYPSLTSLAWNTQRKTPERDSRILIFADPVFKIQDTEGGITSQPSAADEPLDPALGAKVALSLRRLPKTADLADRLSSLFPERGAVYTGMQASKANFMKRVGPSLADYSHVVFATHGIYQTNIPGVMEPFLAMTMVPPGTDGLLRMSDVMSLAMDADLVVLAACQTALGEYISGEGVMSIGYAFRYAGARTVLMSFWQVEETATVQLVERFFHHLKEGMNQIEALALARGDIRTRGYEHPFFWSAFVLQGGLIAR